MAAIQTDKTCTAYINVEVMTDTYKDIALNNVNPAITDDVILNVATQFGGLQAYSINKIKCRRQYTILSE